MEEYNPWWFKEEHPKYTEWKEYAIKWIPLIIRHYDTEPFSLNFIVGPRQVGKTMSIMIYIHHVLLKRINPKAVFYFSCDEVSDYRELGEILDSYLKAKEEWHVKTAYIFLDEITFVEDWWRAIKSRIDLGKFRRDVIYISGSASIEILKQKERFPGRVGHGKEIYYLPMDFAEYVMHFSKLKIETTPVKEKERWLQKLKTLSVIEKKLGDIFLNYIETGGFPLAIRDKFEKGKITISSEKTYLDWIKNDWIKTGKNEKYMKEILSYILRARLAPVSWLKISKETSIRSPNTVASYLETLENLFIIKILYVITPEGKILYRKSKKIHVIDPFIYRVLSRYTRTPVYEEQIVESTVVGHLMRVAEVYYWKNKSEVDIIARINNELLGFEVKWGVKIWRKPRAFKVFLLDRRNIPKFLASINWLESSKKVIS